jgi:hypothetical protein
MSDPKNEQVLDQKWDGKDSFAPEEVFEILGVGRNLGYAEAAKGTLPFIRLGKRLTMPRVRLVRLLIGK